MCATMATASSSLAAVVEAVAPVAARMAEALVAPAGPAAE